jgi:hypothetical protein
MKYYNSELESSNRNFDEKIVKELLDDVKKSIDKSLTKLGKQMSKRCMMSGHNICTNVSINNNARSIRGNLAVCLPAGNK